jgi:predicted ester cyclase
MSTQDNKAVTRRVFDGFNQTGVAIVDEFYTADFVLHDPGSPTQAGGVKSREDFKQYLTGFFASLPGQFTIDDMIAEGDEVVTCWTYRSTHQGQWRGVSPSSKEVTFTATGTSRFVDGKVAETWKIWTTWA